MTLSEHSVGGAPSQGGSLGEHPMGVPLLHSPSALSLAGWTLAIEALRRGMSAWLLVCAWVGLGVSVPGEGVGECSADGGRWVRACFRERAVLCQAARGPFGPNCARACPPGTSPHPVPSRSPDRSPALACLPVLPLRYRSLGTALPGRPLPDLPPAPSPALKQPLWAPHGHCSQDSGLEASPVLPTTS